MAIFNQLLKIIFVICLYSCWMQDAVAIQKSLKTPLSLTNNDDSKIYIAQNQIKIDELSYDDMQKTISKSSDWMPPYKQRRKPWGVTISIGYSLWNPNNYNSFSAELNDLQPQPSQQNFSFSNLYGTKTLADGNTGYISLLAALKYNLATAASLSLGLGGGYYKNKGNNGLELFMIPLTTELTLTIDRVMNEPYFAPYAGIGLAYVYFKEKYPTGAISDPNAPVDPSLPDGGTRISTTGEEKGNQFALYYNVGVLLQLDWLEKGADRSMQLIGVENTYIKVGVIHFFRNIDALNKLLNKDQIPRSRDITSKIALYIGLQLEF